MSIIIVINVQEVIKMKIKQIIAKEFYKETIYSRDIILKTKINEIIEWINKKEDIEMRNPKRIKKILNKIEEIWNQNPDMRFGQLLINIGISKDSQEDWNAEDDDLIRILEKNPLTK